MVQLILHGCDFSKLPHRHPFSAYCRRCTPRGPGRGGWQPVGGRLAVLRPGSPQVQVLALLLSWRQQRRAAQGRAWTARRTGLLRMQRPACSTGAPRGGGWHWLALVGGRLAVLRPGSPQVQVLALLLSWRQQRRAAQGRAWTARRTGLLRMQRPACSTGAPRGGGWHWLALVGGRLAVLRPGSPQVQVLALLLSWRQQRRAAQGRAWTVRRTGLLRMQRAQPARRGEAVGIGWP